MTKYLISNLAVKPGKCHANTHGPNTHTHLPKMAHIVLLGTDEDSASHEMSSDWIIYPVFCQLLYNFKIQIGLIKVKIKMSLLNVTNWNTWQTISGASPIPLEAATWNACGHRWHHHQQKQPLQLLLPHILSPSQNSNVNHSQVRNLEVKRHHSPTTPIEAQRLTGNSNLVPWQSLDII